MQASSMTYPLPNVPRSVTVRMTWCGGSPGAIDSAVHRATRSTGAAGGAQSRDGDIVQAGLETELRQQARQQGVRVAHGHDENAPAALTDQVQVRLTDPDQLVASLAVAQIDCCHKAKNTQQLQGAIDRRDIYDRGISRLVTLGKRVDLVRCGIAIDAVQHRQHASALCGHAHAVASELFRKELFAGHAPVSSIVVATACNKSIETMQRRASVRHSYRFQIAEGKLEIADFRWQRPDARYRSHAVDLARQVLTGIPRLPILASTSYCLYRAFRYLRFAICHLQFLRPTA